MANDKVGVTAVWDNSEQTVIRYDVHKSWSVSDLKDALRAGTQLAETVLHPVDVLVNIVKPSLPRLDGFDFSGLRPEGQSAESGIVVIAANNSFVKNTLTLFLKMNTKLSQIVFVADTVAEARALLAKKRVQRKL